MSWVHIVIALASLSARQPPSARGPACQEWDECQRLALEAYAGGDYERFHDLAWRTIQTGPARNTELMYMLARAQSLSGRPHDAFVMLGRLAGMGFIVADAATDEDFRAVRQLRQWPELEAAIASAAPGPAVPPAAAPRATVAPTPVAPVPVSPAAIPPPALAAPRRAEDALRIAGSGLGSAGLAYDRVSSRFVAAGAGLRKLVIVDERSGHVVDLVTSASAGFYGITGLDIDPVRGDLWVVSAESPTAADRLPASALHKLQLVSGRPLDRIAIGDDLQPCRPGDVAVAPDGAVLVLDTVGNRILRYRPAARTFAPVAMLHLQQPTSFAAAGDRTVYVAHQSGIARADIASGRVEPLAAAPGVRLEGFERIRWARDSLVGVQRLADGSRIAARIRIADGRAAAMDLIDTSLTAADSAVATVSGDDFYFLVHQPGADAAGVVIRRSRLR